MTSPSRARRPRLAIEIVVAQPAPWRPVRGARTAIRDAAAAVARHPVLAGRLPAEAVIALGADDDVRRLNARYRGKDKPTNVLSFPAAAPPGAGSRPLGDIVLAAETVLAEADEQGLAPLDHVRHLVVHGLLHLFGYDHETEEDAVRMEALEVEILAGLGIANPYLDAPSGARRGGRSPRRTTRGRRP